jgi:hypothetical protein
MAKRRNKAAKIREFLADNSNASAAEVVRALAAQRVRVRAAQVYSLKGAAGKPKANGSSVYDSLIQAKRMADAMGGVDKARAALDVLAKLL